MRKPVLFAVALATLVVLGACEAFTVIDAATPQPPQPTPHPTSPPAPTDSGIEGQVLIGPMCPVMREDEACPDQPYQATITVLNQDGAEVARGQSDAQGHFRVGLAPGTYTLRPEPGEGIAHAGEQVVTVSAGQFAQVVVSYDSGIR